MSIFVDFLKGILLALSFYVGFFGANFSMNMYTYTMNTRAYVVKLEGLVYKHGHDCEQYLSEPLVRRILGKEKK